MSILAGSDIAASDFISTSAGAGDSGKVPKLNGSGQLDDSFLVPRARYTVTAGETLAVGDVVYLSDGKEYEGTQSAAYNGSDQSMGVTSNWYSAPYTAPAGVTKLYKVILSMSGSITGGSAGSESVTLSLRANSAGLPTGADLAAVTTVVGGDSQNQQAVVFDFGGFAITAGTSYHFVLRSATANCQYAQCATGGGSSSNSGSTWSSLGTSFKYFAKSGLVRTAGSAYKADPNKYDVRNKVEGIVTIGGAAAASIVIQIAGPVTGLSGLTAGNVYYSSNTPGALSTTPGTYYRRIGRAISATALNLDIEKETFIMSGATPYKSNLGSGDGKDCKRCVGLIARDAGSSSGLDINPAARVLLITTVATNNPTLIEYNPITSVIVANTAILTFRLRLDDDGVYAQRDTGFVTQGFYYIGGYFY